MNTNDTTDGSSERHATSRSTPEPSFWLDDPEYDFLDDVFPVDPPNMRPTREELEEAEVYAREAVAREIARDRERRVVD